MTPTLPPNATKRSQELVELAQEYAHACPPDLAGAIAVTGSASRGVADRFSDVEINFWCESLQEAEVYQQWQKSLGLRPGDLVRKYEGIVALMAYREDGFLVEMCWQTFASLEKTLEEIREGEAKPPFGVVLAWTILHCIPLGGEKIDRLLEHKRAVAIYPEKHGDKLIKENLRYLNMLFLNWDAPTITNYSLAERGAVLTFYGRLSRLLERVLSIYKQYEPDFKWFKPEVSRLTIIPRDLLQRVNDLFMEKDLEVAVDKSMELVIEIVGLVPDSYEQKAALLPILEKARAEKSKGWF
eukprot:comp40142_c0_seq1/m.47413 comp40142_c0_seq1/g.47413  ORF comp40142_c0_seq1/g.47413 comp40142_c0_seq1/m.47413 type:complete len:298 (-) comp40142_c0_seq1:738-1631(-)